MPFIISGFISVLYDHYNYKKKSFFFPLSLRNLSEFAKMFLFIHRLSKTIFQNRSVLASCDMNSLGLLFVFGESSVKHLHPDAETCLLKVHAFGMDPELLLEKCCYRTG